MTTTDLPGKITLQTRMGRAVDNIQLQEFTLLDRKEIEDLKSDYRDVTIRSQPSMIYNCHGLSFASRRCWVPQPSDIQKILQDDGYERIQKIQDVLPGDTVIYIDDNTIEHSGLVVSKAEAPFNSPLIVSKWGKFGEVIHRDRQCPYAGMIIQYFRVTS